MSAFGLSRAAATQLVGAASFDPAIKQGIPPSAILKETEQGDSMKVIRKQLGKEQLEIFEKKRAYCKQLPKGSLRLLDRMVAADPKDRPTPTELLKAGLFAHTNTGCSKDPAATPRPAGGGNFW